MTAWTIIHSLMIRDYIILAVGCFIIGVVIALATVAAAVRFRIDIMGDDVWLLVVPAVLALVLNIIMLEIYRKFKKKKGKKKKN